jgi:hypothetical protein
MNPQDIIQYFEDNPNKFKEYLLNYFGPEDFVEICLEPAFGLDEEEWDNIVKDVLNF